MPIISSNLPLITGNLECPDSMTLLITAFNSSLTSIAITWGLGIIISLTGISETLNTPRIIWYESWLIRLSLAAELRSEIKSFLSLGLSPKRSLILSNQELSLISDIRVSIVHIC